MQELTYHQSQIFWEKIQDRLEIQVKGQITEKFFQPPFIFPMVSFVALRLKDVKAFNSTGVRQWFLMMEQFKSATVVAFDCSIAVIDNLNLVSGLLGTAWIHSFYAPYYNSETEEEMQVLIDTRVYREDLINMKAPQLSKDMEFDSLPSQYFKEIVKRIPPQSLVA